MSFNSLLTPPFGEPATFDSSCDDLSKPFELAYYCLTEAYLWGWGVIVLFVLFEVVISESPEIPLDARAVPASDPPPFAPFY